MKTTDQLQNPQRTLLADPPRVRGQIPPRESEQGLASTPPAGAPPGVPMPSEVSTGASVSALMVPEDYRARAVAVQARERILRSPELSSLALDGATAFNGPSSVQLFFESPLRPLLEEVVEEVIAEIDGAPPPGALPGSSRAAPGLLHRFMPRVFSGTLSLRRKPGKLPGVFTAHPAGPRAAERGTAPWSYPSVEHVPVDRELALRYLGSELYGFGALDLLLEAGEKLGAAITDIYVNSPCDIWAGIGGEVRPVALSLGNEQRVRALAERLIRRRGGQLDTAHPATDVSDEVGRRSSTPCWGCVNRPSASSFWRTPRSSPPNTSRSLPLEPEPRIQRVRALSVWANSSCKPCAWARTAWWWGSAAGRRWCTC